MSEPIDVARLGFLLAAAAWIGWELVTGGSFGLLQGIIVYTHEGGHLVCMFLGRFITIAGGTLMQLALPIAVAVRFWLRGERYSAAITCFWLVASLAGSATYCRDALAPDLPLLFSGMSATEEMEAYGETSHDWLNMLDMLGLPVKAAHPIGGLLQLAAYATWLAGLAIGLASCGIKLPATAAKKPQSGPRTRRTSR